MGFSILTNQIKIALKSPRSGLDGRGIDEIILTAIPYWRCPKKETATRRDNFDICDACFCPPEEETLSQGYWEANPLIIDAPRVFGAGGTWGILSIHDPPYPILGGTKAFMDDCLERAGGLDAVQERFRYHDVSEGDLGRDLWRSPDRRLELYRMLGWEAPEIPTDLKSARGWIEEWGMRLGRAQPKYVGPYED